MPSPGHELLTTSSIATLAVAAFATVTVGNTARNLLRRDSPWIPFVVAEALAFSIASYQQQLGSFLGWMVAFLNGCLIFVTAAGGNEAATRPAGSSHRGREIRWAQSWFR
jgi:hypothetical protein